MAPPTRFLRNIHNFSASEGHLEDLGKNTYYGQLIMVNLLWSTYYGQLIMVNLLWSTYYGQLARAPPPGQGEMSILIGPQNLLWSNKSNY
jgi:hypothetical protein